MKEEEEFDFTEDQIPEEPQAKKFTDKDLVRWVSILFVFGIYFYIFLKILVIS